MEVVSRAASRTAAAPELRETNDPLMQAYLVARSEPTRAGAIQKARRVVELACAELAERDPELRSTSFGRARALDSQLGKLEKRSRAGLGAVPSAAIAAMRLVQAQGNYWSHANRETVARQETFEQVMDALSLVVRTLRREQLRTKVRTPLLALPSLTDALRMRRAVGQLPTLGFGDGRADFVLRGPSYLRVLPVLDGFYASELEVCSTILTLVLERECDLTRDRLPLQELVLHLREVSEARPDRVPDWVAGALVGVLRRADDVKHVRNEYPASAVGDPDLAEREVIRLIEEATRPTEAHELLRWFEEDYLRLPAWHRRLAWPRRWRLALVLVVALLIVAFLEHHR